MLAKKYAFNPGAMAAITTEFLNNSISFETYDQGIINIYNKIKPSDKKYFIKKFSLDDCKGNSLICSEYKKVKSTNDIAIKLIKKNNTCPMLVTSEQQTNGRGRVGKKWISQKGNLFIFW